MKYNIFYKILIRIWKVCTKHICICSTFISLLHHYRKLYISYCIRNAILGNNSCFKAGFYKAKFFDQTKILNIEFWQKKPVIYTFKLPTKYNDQWFLIQLSRRCCCSLFCIYILRRGVSLQGQQNLFLESWVKYF